MKERKVYGNKEREACFKREGIGYILKVMQHTNIRFLFLKLFLKKIKFFYFKLNF